MDEAHQSRRAKALGILRDYVILTAATWLMVVGIYVFKFPNNFSFGGVSGFSVLLGKITPLTPGTWTMIINMGLLVLGFLLLGRSFGVRTAYVSILMSVSISALEKIAPMDGPLTNQPVLELLFAIGLPAISSAILFNIGASSGGTDILAMILRKFTSIHIGMALLAVDIGIVCAAAFVFDITTALFSLVGLLAKSLMIDGVIENINLCKYFTIVCDHPEPICHFITEKLNRSATTFHATGSYSHRDKVIILTVMRRSQAVQLRAYIRQIEPTAFMMITNSSEIIGKGFRGFN